MMNFLNTMNYMKLLGQVIVIFFLGKKIDQLFESIVYLGSHELFSLTYIVFKFFTLLK